MMFIMDDFGFYWLEEIKRLVFIVIEEVEENKLIC